MMVMKKKHHNKVKKMNKIKIKYIKNYYISIKKIQKKKFHKLVKEMKKDMKQVIQIIELKIQNYHVEFKEGNKQIIKNLILIEKM